jgi:beta-lactamase superfamily II metal-dependent hydrolase
MIFTLEALEAKHGDALILHHGTKTAPRLVVIDGGPRGVYNKSLRPRLEELKASRAPGGALAIDLLMVSHIDDDHIQGVLELIEDLVDLDQNDEELPYDIKTLWHNGFDDLTKADPADVASAAEAVRPVALGDAPPGDVSRQAALILVSVPQGKKLRSQARLLDLKTPGLVTYKGGAAKSLAVGAAGGLSFRVVGPSAKRVEALRKEWTKTVKKKSKVSPVEWQAIAAAYVDDAVANLSSIVVLASVGKRSMLLTGDARGDDILAALKEAKLLKAGRLHVDLLKLPHHGSDRNVEIGFFEDITADHYVISADGRFDNPDVETLDMIAKARKKSAYTVYVTNSIPRVNARLKAMKVANPKLKIVVRDKDALSVKVELGDPVPD